MKANTITERVNFILEPKKPGVKARLFVAREDGITIYDSIQNNTTTSVSALVSGVWQASEALMNLIHPQNDVLEFRLAFDTSSRGIYLFPFETAGSKYFLGAIYNDCLNPGLLKRQISNIKNELHQYLESQPIVKKSVVSQRQGYLFQDISDEEIDRLFSLGGI
jgi:hypothetical protein